MKLIFWIITGICLLIAIDCFAGTLSSYPSQSTLASGDRIPAVIASGGTNANINWYSLKEFMSKSINWTDVKSLTKSGGSGATSGINWQDFGA